MVRMKVKLVGYDQRTSNPVVIITDDDERGFIPIVIGESEAAAIALEMEGKRPPRPITHDLLKNVIEALHANVSKVVISDLKANTYYARVFLETDDGEVDIDARPSDAIALALRSNAPIYVSDEVASQALVTRGGAEADSTPITDEEAEEFRRFLEDVSPEDFRKNYNNSGK